MRASDVNPSAGVRQAAPSLCGKQDAAELRQACQQFEAVFLAKLLEKMRDTVPKDPLLGESHAQDIYYGMLDWERAQQIARLQSVGIAEALYRQLSAYLGRERGDVEAGPADDG